MLRGKRDERTMMSPNGMGYFLFPLVSRYGTSRFSIYLGAVVTVTPNPQTSS